MKPFRNWCFSSREEGGYSR